MGGRLREGWGLGLRGEEWGMRGVSLRAVVRHLGSVRPKRDQEERVQEEGKEANYRQVTGMHTQGQVPLRDSRVEKENRAPAICALPTKQGRSTMASAAAHEEAKKAQTAKGRM